jgi:hypothetical protein
MAEACVLASFNGTSRHGTTVPDLEATALDRLDDAESALARAKPGEQTRLRQAAEQAAARASKLGNVWQFRHLLASLPARAPRVEALVDGSLLSTAVPSGMIGELAVLMHSRRTQATFRGFQAALARVRLARHNEPTPPALAWWREALLLALSLHPQRRIYLTPTPDSFVSRRDALDAWRRYATAERHTTVITGDFHPETVAELIRRVFVKQAGETLAPPAMPVEPPQLGERSTTVTAGEPRLVLVWQTSPDTPLAALEVVAELIGGNSSDLVSRLVHERRLAKSIEARARFPGLDWPSLFMLEATATDQKTYPELQRALLEWLDGMRGKGPGDAALEQAIRVWQTAREALSDNPEALALDLAVRAGLDAQHRAEVRTPTKAEIQLLLPALLAPAGCTRIETKIQPTRASGSAPAPGRTRE